MSSATVHGHRNARNFGAILRRNGIQFVVDQQGDTFTFTKPVKHGAKKGDGGGAGSSASGKDDELFQVRERIPK